MDRSYQLYIKLSTCYRYVKASLSTHPVKRSKIMHEELIALTRELTEMLRRNRTIDWQKKETARAQMRKMVKRLLKKYKYLPEDYDFAINTVISQCELWTDNVEPQKEAKIYKYVSEIELDKVAQDSDKYGE